MINPADIDGIRRMMQGTKPCVLVFRANLCSDCIFIEPFMPGVAAKYAADLDFVNVDRDRFPDLVEELGIVGIPSFVVFRAGRELVRFVSPHRKTREAIETFLDRAVQVAKALPPKPDNQPI